MARSWVACLTAVLTLTLAGERELSAQCISEASPYGINAHAPQGASLAPLLDEVHACGIGWIRIDFVWSWVEPIQGNFTWGMYDDLVAAANTRGLHIYATIGNTPAWATSGTAGIGVPNNAADFYDVCYRAAQRYQGSIDYWGMWNEPNLSQFWAGTRAQYIDIILKNGADAVHAVGAKACGPELAHLSSGSWDAWLTDCINQAGNKLDVVTHHGYSSSGYSGITDKLDKAPVWPWDPPCVKQILQNTGWFGRPFWLTETGWESAKVGEANQAVYYTGLLNDWFTGQLNRSWVDKIFFYELSDSTVFPTISFGILGADPDYPRKPSFTAYQDFIAAYPPAPVVPGKAGTPSPANVATLVDVDAKLSWSSATCATSYDVYFGTTRAGTFRGNRTSTTYDPGIMSRYMTYYWRIDTVNGSVKTVGDVWHFSTAGVRADFDNDMDVDQTDFAFLQTCLSGRGEPVTTGCGPADLDGDGDVDGGDVDIFRACMAGANHAPGC